MRLLKKGFTLAEILVAMGIVGIIAATTVPMVAKQGQKTQVGPKLGKMIEQIEVGCRNMIEFANENSNAIGEGYLLSDFTVGELTDANNNNSLALNFVANSTGFLGLEPIETNLSEVKNFNGARNAARSLAISRSNRFNFKKINASAYVVQSDDEPTNPNSLVATYYLDVNGIDTEPNAFGKDIFLFELTNDCRVVPYILDEDSCEENNITTGLTCGNQIVKDNFKITYY